MVHEIAIQLMLVVLGPRASNIALYASSTTLTLLIATASYSYFEKPFLRLKASFR